MSTLTQLSIGELLPRTPRSDDPALIHRAVMGLFASVPELDGAPRREGLGVLWRVEPEGAVLVRSDVAPTNLPTSARMREEPAPTFEAGQDVLFRLAVNAIERPSAASGGGHRPVDDIEAWLARKLDPALAELAVFSHDRSVSRSRERGITVQRDLVDGSAVVGDPGVLAELLARGVGRAKAFGCGLLTVVRT